MKFLKKSAEYRYVRMVMRRYEKHLPRWGLLAVAVGKLALVAFLAFHSIAAKADAPKESVYDRVMKTGTIRCGYGGWDIYLSKDANTGKLSGIYYDYMEQLGKNLGLKIEWTEEVGWGDYIAGLTNDRFDAFCTVVSWNAQRARQADFVTPLFFMLSDVYVRKGDTRFDDNLALIDDPKITMVTLEGDIYDKISAAEYPKAKKMTLPQLATSAELFSAVADGKADVLITESSSGAAFMHNNPGKIQKVKLPGPFRASPESISIKGGEFRFQRMLDISTVEMLTNGSVKKILDKYDPQRAAVMDTADFVKVQK